MVESLWSFQWFAERLLGIIVVSLGATSRRWLFYEYMEKLVALAVNYVRPVYLANSVFICRFKFIISPMVFGSILSLLCVCLHCFFFISENFIEMFS